MKLPLLAVVSTISLSAVSRADVLTITADRDNTLYESATGELSNGAGIGVFSGVNTGLSPTIRRGLIHFDVGAIPAGSVVDSVRLRLTVTRSPLLGGPEDVALHRLLADWGEGTSDPTFEEGPGAPATTDDATWLHTFFSSATWTAAGGDFDPTALAVRTVNAPGTYFWESTAAMVADVQAWLDAPGANFGWMVKHVDEATTLSARRFASRHVASVTLRPAIEVGFTPPPCSASNYCTSNPSSTGFPAVIGFSGSCVALVNDFTLTAGPLPDQPFLFFFGNSQIQVPFGNGFLCAGGGIVRINPPAVASGGTATREVDLAASAITSGVTKNFQCWFRDPAGGGAFFNTSDGLAVTFQ